MKENDLKEPPLSIQRLADIKKLWYHIRLLQCQENDFYSQLNVSTSFSSSELDKSLPYLTLTTGTQNHREVIRHDHSSLSPTHLLESTVHNVQNTCQSASQNKPVFSTSRGEKRKLFASFIYALISGIWTSFIMVVVHNRVPNVQKYKRHCPS